MDTKKLLIALMTIAVVACQPAKTRKASAIRGRAARGTVTYDQFGRPLPFQSTGQAAASNRQLGEVTSVDQNWDEEIYAFTFPQLSGVSTEDQLGFVSGQSNQSTGVRLGGYIYMKSNGQPNGGTMDIGQSWLHIEIYDDKVGTLKSDGKTVQSQLIVHIGQDSEAARTRFVSANGNASNGQVDLMFSDRYGSLFLSGTVSGDTYSGTIRYTNSYRPTGPNGQPEILGQFRVPTCGFFVCQN